MSTDLILVNKDKKEYIEAFGNSSYRDYYRNNFPEFIMWMLQSEWINNSVLLCRDYDEEYCNYKDNYKEITFEYYNKFKRNSINSKIKELKKELGNYKK